MSTEDDASKRSNYADANAKAKSNSIGLNGKANMNMKTTEIPTTRKDQQMRTDKMANTYLRVEPWFRWALLALIIVFACKITTDWVAHAGHAVVRAGARH
jgi:hypothetical protein